MSKSAVTSVSASTTATVLLGQSLTRRGVSLTQTDTNTLRLYVGSTLTSSLCTTALYTAPIGTGAYWESPIFYRGEALIGIWDSTAGGKVLLTEFQ